MVKDGPILDIKTPKQIIIWLAAQKYTYFNLAKVARAAGLLKSFFNSNC